MPPADRRRDPDFAELLLASHHRLVGRPLAPEGDAAWLYEAATFALLAHDGGADPRFIYANAAAQRCFGYSWDEFAGMPSRLSAEAPERGERQRALEAVARHGFIENYRGVRIARSGRRFIIEDATVWMLVDAEGVSHGQAAAIRRWREVG